MRVLGERQHTKTKMLCEFRTKMCVDPQWSLTVRPVPHDDVQSAECCLASLTAASAQGLRRLLREPQAEGRPGHSGCAAACSV